MKELSVAIIGSGNVASFLCRALTASGLKVSTVVSRNSAAGKSLAAETGAVWQPCFHAPENEKQIIISAVKDSAAQELWKQCDFGENLVLHTAGALPLEALAPYAVNYGVLYPLQSISAGNLPAGEKVPFLIEASSSANLETIRKIALRLSPHVCECSSTARVQIHLAAVFANNFSNLCFRYAWEIAQKGGINPQLLLPLIEESCTKLHRLSPAEAQTGPAVRWDENVMAKHLKLLADMPQAADFYRMASAEIHRLGKGKSN